MKNLVLLALLGYFATSEMSVNAIKVNIRTFHDEAKEEAKATEEKKDEKAEAKKEKQKIKQAKANKAAAAGGSMDDLAKMILAKRDNAFGGFVNYMEQKYGGDQEDDIFDFDENDQPNK